MTIALLLFAGGGEAQASASVTLAWNADSSPGLAGYCLYQGGASGIYTNKLTLGNRTNATVSALATGTKYYFAVTAYTSNGMESSFSNEIGYTAPTNAIPGIALTAPNNNGAFAAPATVNLAATVTPNGNTISKVQFFNGSTLLGESLSAPYALVWNKVAVGTYSLSASAVYGAGSSVSSATASIIVTNSVGVLPPPWQSVDIGIVGVTGNAIATGGTYTISGAGNVGGSTDNFRFLYQPMNGDGELRARISSLQNTTANACAGVMIRETLTPGSRSAFLGVSPAGTMYSEFRTRTLKSSSTGSSTAGAMPNAWVRLVRAGNTFSTYTSSDGAAWTLRDSKSITMATNIYLGLAVASGTTTLLTVANVTNVLAVP